MPVDRSSIDEQLREIGEGERWWEQREFRDLPYILHPGERIRGITLGKLLGRRRPRLPLAAPWLFVATDQRLLCLRHERFARKQVDIPWSQITRLHQRGGLRSHEVVVETPERRYRLRVPRQDALRFATTLTQLAPRPQRPVADLGPLAWIPGMTTVAALPGFSGVVTKVAMLSPPDYATRVEKLEATVERLQGEMDRLQSEVEQLQQQTSFLEALLQKRAAEAALTQPDS